MIPTQNTVLSSTFDFWRNRTNELANYMSTCVITTDSNGATVNTTGNAVLTGSFWSNNLTVGNSSVNTAITWTPSTNTALLKLSNTTVNTSLRLPTTAQYGNNWHLAANGIWTYVSVSNGEVTLLNSGVPDVIDSYPMTAYRGAEYLVSVKDTTVSPSTNAYQIAKVLTIHDTNNALITEYGQLSTNNRLGTFTVGTNATHVILYFTAVAGVANSVVRYVKTII